MLVVVTGISHKTASLELRERLALDEARRPARGAGAARERRRRRGRVARAPATAPSCTCTPTTRWRRARRPSQRLARHAGVDVRELESSLYSYSGDAAIAHLFRVTSSLDSMVVGEAQIVAQMKAAYQQACEGGCTSVVFNRLFRHALEVGKRVRTETAIGERPVSVSSAAVELALPGVRQAQGPHRAHRGRRRDQRAHGHAPQGARHRDDPRHQPHVRRRGGAGPPGRRPRRALRGPRRCTWPPPTSSSAPPRRRTTSSRVSVSSAR